MKHRKLERTLSVLLAGAIVISLAGCGASTGEPVVTESTFAVTQEPETQTTLEATVTSTETVTEPSTEPEVTTEPTEVTIIETMPEVETTPAEPVDEYGMTATQRNSISMLYYLAITAEQIRTAKDSRLTLDDVYTSLLNDINPGTVDEKTQTHLTTMRDRIKRLMEVSTRRERLLYIYNQDKAVSIRSAVPNPIAVLATVESFDWRSLVTSVAYTVVDSYSSYKNTNDAIDREYLISGWELDDNELRNIWALRDDAFNYMVDIVRENGLDGSLTLNEKAIEMFVTICEIDSVHQKIRRLTSEEETYKLLGNYWLELASCYYETEQYQKCLDCVARYNSLTIGIYRKDNNYASVLPKAIVAAQNAYTGDDYVSAVQDFADAILSNTTTDEWAIRYFAAQTYLDLYAKTEDGQYLKKAYNIAYDNVTILIDQQRLINETFMAPVQELTVNESDYKDKKDDAYKAELKRVKAYNKALQETRKTELPALYEPLVVNCELLFALADEMHISIRERQDIQKILRTDTNGVFLVEPVNHHFSFTSSAQSTNGIIFEKNELQIPVQYMSADATVTVTVLDDGVETTFDDFIVQEVQRNGDTLDTFIVQLNSKSIKKYDWTADSSVTLEIRNRDGIEPVTVFFRVSEFKDNKIFADKVVFEQA